MSTSLEGVAAGVIAGPAVVVVVVVVAAGGGLTVCAESAQAPARLSAMNARVHSRGT
jgi:hypothetical protein